MNTERSFRATIPPAIEHSAIDYAAKLAAHTKENVVPANGEGKKEYLNYSMRTVTVRGKEINTFAPFRHKLSAFQTLTRGQIVLLCLFILLCILSFAFLGIQMLVVGLAIITLLYLGDLALSFFLALQTLSHSAEARFDDAIVKSLDNVEWPMYTILCPLYKEARIVPQFASAMQGLDYPVEKLQILFLTEENDEETRKAIQALQLPSHFQIVTVPEGEPRTKPRACNFGLLLAEGDYIVIYDAEDIPDPLQLKKAVLTFAHASPDVACVQAKLNFYNPNQSVLTRWFTAEYSLWFDLILPGLQRLDLPLPLGGTSNHFRAHVLRTLGAWDPFNVTEDCDLGLRLARYGLKTSMLDSVTREEATSKVKNWLRQRSRWIKGYMQTYLVYMRQPQRYLHPKRWLEFISLQVVIGGKTAVLFVNPLMWLLVALYIFFRPLVGDTYHWLFPTAVLYMGTICLVFGNFFYAYSHMVGCLKRREYGLIKWTLLIPLYWLLTSVAAFIALYQLVFRPHYWEKTQHGFHLDEIEDSAMQPVVATLKIESNTFTSNSQQTATSQQPAQKVATTASSPVDDKVEEDAAALKRRRADVLGLDEFFAELDKGNKDLLPIPTVTESIKAIKTSTPADVAAVQQRKLSGKRVLSWVRLHDSWLVATIIIACTASIVSLCYFFQQHQLLTYGDSYSHMLIARRLFDSSTPGLAQLGGVWLPLPHLLMLPFIWNDYLWHTGLAGSFAAMPCYVVASIYLFLAARRLTRNNLASFVGALLFVLNLNVLYLQTTPLSEIVLIAALTMASYHFLAWAQDNSSKQLILTAAGTFLATMARYDGWFLFLAFFAAIAVVSWLRRDSWKRVEGNILVFGFFGGLGVALWFLWCGVIFGDPLYWQRGPFSSQAQQQSLIQAHILYTYHNLWQSIRYFGLDSMANVGTLLFVLGMLAVLVFVLQRRVSVDTVAALIFLTPFVFYVVSLFDGQAALYVTSAVPASAPNGLYNARYGVQAVAPIALFIATLISSLSRVRVPRIRFAHFAKQYAGLLLFVPLIVGQTVWIANTGIVSLQDGLYGLDCAPSHSTVVYLAQHYTGGRILEDTFTSPEPGVDFKNVIYEGSNALWKRALAKPEAMVDWIMVDPTNKNDLVAENINVKSSAFLANFEVVVQEPKGLLLFHRKGLAPLPNRSLADSLITPHDLCGTGGPKRAYQDGIVFSTAFLSSSK